MLPPFAMPANPPEAPPFGDPPFWVMPPLEEPAWPPFEEPPFAWPPEPAMAPPEPAKPLSIGAEENSSLPPQAKQRAEKMRGEMMFR